MMFGGESIPERYRELTKTTTSQKGAYSNNSDNNVKGFCKI